MLQRRWIGNIRWLTAALAFGATAGEISGAITPEALAQQALDDVADQLRTGTTQADSAWASQPGAIRSFGTDGTSEQIYKLYSSDEPVVANAAAAIDDVPQDAAFRRAQFADLNAPVADADGNMQFPVADPRAYRGLLATDSAEGFRYHDAIFGVQEPGGLPPQHQRLPMPVRWLYVLQDGTCGYLDATDKFVGENPATTENPIVARYAYWTDDESCKINVNTASEAAHWDMPRADTPQERAYAEFQPAGKEYQRIPGHPATVCLSSVLFPGKRYPESLTLAETKQLWRLTPGVNSVGGSEGGTRRVQANDQLSATGAPHSNLDDFLDSEDLPEASRLYAKQSRFLLTTHSEAPAQNLHGKPQVLAWPIAANPLARTPIDIQMADLADNAGDDYFVQRSDPLDRHSDYYSLSGGTNVQLADYLKSQTEQSLPGTGSSLADKYGDNLISERDAIVGFIMDYLRMANPSDPTATQPFTPDSGIATSGQVTPLCFCGGADVHVNNWDNPTTPRHQGIGRSYVITEIALVFIVRAFNGGPGFNGGDPDDVNALDSGKKLIDIGLMLETFSPAHGFSTITPDVRVEIGSPTVDGIPGTNLPPFTVNSFNFNGFPNRSLIGNIAPAADYVGKRPWGGYGGTRLFSSTGAPDNQSGLYWEQLPKVDGSEPRFVNVLNLASNTMTFTGSTEPLAIRLYDTSVSGDFADLIQEYRVQIGQPDFPDQPFTIPAPKRVTSQPPIWRWKDRVEQAAGDPNKLIDYNDVVRSVVVSHSDARLVAGKRILDHSDFKPHRDFSSPTTRFAHSLIAANGTKAIGFNARRGYSLDQRGDPLDYPLDIAPDLPIAPSGNGFYNPTPGTPHSSYSVDPGVTGDWDNGLGSQMDGPYINFPDGMPFVDPADGIPYFDQLDEPISSHATIFSTKRAIPSPGMFGSLPTGVQSNIPWRTLLFRPDPQHYGASETPDHLWMDLFRTPTVEPEGLSSRWADKGKINLNFQILPFTYIERATAMHALLKSERILAIPTSAALEYKTEGGPDYRSSIDPDLTLRQAWHRFQAGKVFRSATEICELYLVPDGPSHIDRLGALVDGDYPTMRAFWQNHALTGDNSKERPYTTLYSNVTTRSNRFQVHVKAQTISKSPASPADTFDPQSDAITDEVSGNGFVTRRIVDAAVPGYMTAPNAPRLDHYAVFDTELAEISRPRPHRIIQITIDESTGFLPQIDFEVAIDLGYSIERSGDLINWTQIDTRAAVEALNSYTDTTGTIPEGRAHYRIRQF